MATLLEPYLPLYLKHRPQTLNQLVGQSTVVKTLTNAIDNDRIAHAYLFTGPRGCGKTSSARILAKSLNCENGPTAEPCMTCSACEEIKKGISPAVMEIDAASNNSVDDARVLIERAPLVAQGGRFKLYIIDECHMLTKEAFNALLKTIEEPPPKVIFILATTEEHKVPPTIISRCQRLMFRLVNHDELCAHLRVIADIEKIHIEDAAIELIARRSGGGLRDALGLLDQASLLASEEKPVGIKDLLTLLGAIEEDVLLAISEGIANRDAEKVLSSAHQLLAQGREPSLVALELAKHFLNLAKGLHLANPKKSEKGVEVSLAQQLITGSQDYIERVIKMATTFEGAELTQIVMELDKLEQTLRRSTQPSLALEVGLLALCHRHDILLVKELAQKVEILENAIAGGADLRPVSSARPVAPTQVSHEIAAPPVSRPAPAAAAPSPAPAPAPAPARTAAPPASESWDEPANLAARIHVNEDNAVNEDGDVEIPASGNDGEVAEDNSTEDNSAEDKNIGDAAESKKAAVQSAPTATNPEVPAAAAPVVSVAPAMPVSSAPAPIAAKSSDKMALSNSEDLDEFWSNLLSDLQSRHLPSFSVISQFGFPLSLRDDELVIGTLKDNLQKMLEAKAPQIQKSAKIITGRDLFIKVKVTSQENTPPPVKATTAPATRPPGDGPNGANRGQSQEKASAPRAAAQEEGGDEEPGEPVLAAQASQLRSTASSGPSHSNNPSPGQQLSASAPTVASSSRPSAAELVHLDSGPGQVPTDNQMMVKEAYRLFEGPGSRRIG